MTGANTGNTLYREGRQGVPSEIEPDDASVLLSDILALRSAFTTEELKWAFTRLGAVGIARELGDASYD